jgi:hypothetical protein
MDLHHDTVASARRIWLHSVTDLLTREALALEVATSLPKRRVVRVLDSLGNLRPLQARLVQMSSIHSCEFFTNLSLLTDSVVQLTSQASRRCVQVT